MASLLQRHFHRRLSQLYLVCTAGISTEVPKVQTATAIQRRRERSHTRRSKKKASEILNQFQALSQSESYSALKWESAVTSLESAVDLLSPNAVARLVHLCKFSQVSQPKAISLLVHRAQIYATEDAFNDVEAATVIHSLAALVRSSKGVPHSTLHPEIQALALTLSEALVKLPRVRRLSDRVLANVVYGLGVLFKSDGPEMHHPRLAAVIEALSQEICREHHLVAFAQQGLANILYGYGCLRWRSDAVLWRLSREIINRVGGFKTQEIAYMIFALGRLNYAHEALIVTLGIEAVSGQHLTRFSEQELCNMLHGLSVLIQQLPSIAKLQPVLEWLLREAGVTPRIKRYNRQDLSTLLQSIATLKTHMELKPPLDTLPDRLLDQFVMLTGETSKLDRHLNAVLSACAKMQLKNDDLLERANCLILSQSQELESLWTVTLLLWALASLEALTPDAFVALGHQICLLRERGEEMTDRNWVQLTQATQYMEQSSELVELDPQLRDLLEEALNISKATHDQFTLPSNPMRAP